MVTRQFIGGLASKRVIGITPAGAGTPAIVVQPTVLGRKCRELAGIA
jgi:hypothetical protein